MSCTNSTNPLVFVKELFDEQVGKGFSSGLS